MHHPDGGHVPDADARARGVVPAWGGGLELSVRTGVSVARHDGRRSFRCAASRTQLQERATALPIAGPFAASTSPPRRQLSAFSDGNTRARWRAFVRLSLLHRNSRCCTREARSGSRAHRRCTGIPVATRALRRRGVRAATPARVVGRRARVAGTWRGRPSAPRRIPDSIVSRRWAATSPPAPKSAYRGERWEIGTTLGYGRGRTGSYERFDVVVQVRLHSPEMTRLRRRAIVAAAAAVAVFGVLGWWRLVVRRRTRAAAAAGRRRHCCSCSWSC